MNILDSEIESKIPESPEDISLFLASIIRNEMEGIHSKYIPDTVMVEMNKIVRNSIFTGLRLLQETYSSDQARKCVALQAVLFQPDYWDKPELIDSFKQLVDM